MIFPGNKDGICTPIFTKSMVEEDFYCLSSSLSSFVIRKNPKTKLEIVRGDKLLRGNKHFPASACLFLSLRCLCACS